MKADYTSYARATSASLVGLGMQAVLGLVLLIYGREAESLAAFDAAVVVFLGIPAWLTLAILFDQHRRERIESMEQDALGDAGVGSVFQKTAEDFRPAARRLAMTYKVVVPAVSILMALGYIGFGLMYLKLAIDRHLWESMPAAKYLETGLGLTVAVAVASFFVARYAAGMARQKVWSNLRGGAAVAGGAAVVSFATAIGLGVDIFGPDIISRYLTVLIPGLMLVLGAEVVVNFLLNLYRPRKAGEIPRPSFDSRLLSLVAAPDTVVKSIGDAISYQLGYDVTGNWFYQLVSKLVGPMLAAGALILLVLSSVAIVQPHQLGIITRFGEVVREVGPGAHFKLPWPMEELEVPIAYTRDESGRFVETGRTATGTRVIQLGSLPSLKPGAILWTTDHAGTEVFHIVQPSRFGATDSGTSDLAQVAVECAMAYEVTNVKAFESLAPPKQRDDLLRAVAQRELVHFFSALSIDELLGPERSRLGGRIKTRIETAFADLNPGPDGKPMGAGVAVVSLNVAKLHPHKDVAVAYERIVEADQRSKSLLEAANAQKVKAFSEVAGSVDRATQINSEIAALERLRESKSSARELIEQELKIRKLMESATGMVASSLADAGAQRWHKHMTERAMASRYEGLLASYNASPSIFKASIFFDSWKEALGKSVVYLTSDDIPNLRIDADVKMKDSGVDVFRVDKDANAGK